MNIAASTSLAGVTTARQPPAWWQEDFGIFGILSFMGTIDR